MALEEYKRKRDFKKTPEPPPDRVKAGTSGSSYLIQKHDATRLHYDFRLELDGVLLSWAVTKGPSLNPADKRLAVRTEDHPVSYGTFEGTIPEGEYGGGTVMLWDEGTWEPKDDPHAGLKRGRLSFVLHGERLKGAWNLVHMRGDGKRENWLLIKEKDAHASQNGANGDFLDDLSFSVKSRRSMEEIAAGAAAPRTRGARIANNRRPPAPPRARGARATNNRQPPALRPARAARTANNRKPPAPRTRETRTANDLSGLMERYPEVQLATLVDQAPEGAGWLHEIKFDGYRLLGFVSGGTHRLRTRNGKDWTERFPSFAEALENLKAKDAVIDMEAVILDAHGKSSFQALQAALGNAGNAQKIVAYAFDLLHLDGKDLTKLPLAERKEKLQSLLKTSKLKPNSALRYSEHIVGNGGELLASACAQGLEGIVSKQAGAPYTIGRQKGWLKTKCAQRQEFIILGFSAARTGDRALGALYLGYRKDGALRYAGKVGTGFTMKGAQDLTERFARLAVTKPVLTRAETGGIAAREWQSISWIKPILLCEVAFTEWTQDGRIRHPAFQGLREDKDARDVKKEKPVPIAATSGTAPAKTKAGFVAGGITITNPDRVISETGHITKGALAEYYAEVAPLILPSIGRHPLSLLRCPSGIDGECFYQRNPGKGMGPDVYPYKFKQNGKTNVYLYIEDQKGLLELIQMGAIEIHPWGARIDNIDYPDRMIFDLDPAPEVPFEALKLAAQDLRQRLQKKGLESTLKCTGGKGLHVTVSLAGKDEWPAVKTFAAAVAQEMVAAAPDAYIATMSKAKRSGKIFIDYFRNDYTATAIADYAVRARPGAPVAMPLNWKELKSLKSASQFTMKDALKRLKGKRPDVTSRKQGQTVP